MKILVVGSDKIFAIENFYVKYLKHQGLDIFHFPAQSILNNYYHKNILNKLFFRFGLSSVYFSINKQLKSFVLSERPDVVWVFKGMEIFPETLQWIKSHNIKLVSYNPDNPFLFSGRGSGNSNVTASIGLYDLHFTYNYSVLKLLNTHFLTKTAILPFGFDLNESLFNVCQLEKEIIAVCFLGNPDEKRAEFIMTLANNGMAISVYGNHWNKFVNHENIAICHPVYGAEQWKVLRKYRVQLNLMRPHNDDSHNMRTFEVPGIGGIMVAPDTPEHRLFFKDGKEVFLFENETDCLATIKMLLDLSFQDAMKIRSAARARSLRSGYTYESRAGQVITELKKLLGE